ncbi:MAG: pyridoxamine 5'-phosphate oxidase family protein [Clostridiales bacterium]|nr:pyridoxamine 5'-phosphate oxidase family protein [Clostridiales bacterium]
MRRKDREITDKEGLLAILQDCAVCRLGLSVENRPYVVPLNFGYSWKEHEPLRLFFHSAPKGTKLDMLSKNDLACFEMDCGHQLLGQGSACGYSFAYASIIGWGRVTLLTETEEKRRALSKIMERQAGPGSYTFGEKELAQVAVLCLTAQEITGKKNPTKTA